MELSRGIDVDREFSAPNFRGGGPVDGVVPEIIWSVSRCVLRHVHLTLSVSRSSRQMIAAS